MGIKPIETYYNGYRFRSRLEARWAVFFDTLGVKYEYEPEGFALPSGRCYLPDFRVKCYGCRGKYPLSAYEILPFSEPPEPPKPFDLYIEVKGKMTQEDADRIKEFSGTWKEAKGISYFEIQNPVLIVGNIPPLDGSSDSEAVGAYKEMDGVDIYPFNYELIDGDHFAAYPAAHNGYFYLWGDDSNYIDKDDRPAVEKAYAAARIARFEHGETPII